MYDLNKIVLTFYQFIVIPKQVSCVAELLKRGNTKCPAIQSFYVNYPGINSCTPISSRMEILDDPFQKSGFHSENGKCIRISVNINAQARMKNEQSAPKV